jgi:hypothetical protein
MVRVAKSLNRWHSLGPRKLKGFEIGFGQLSDHFQFHLSLRAPDRSHQGSSHASARMSMAVKRPPATD